MDFTLRQLSYFVAIAEAGTITEAGIRLHVSASALSGALTDLERSLGVQLVVRRKAHGITLTSSGRRVLETARAALRAADEVRFVGDAAGGELVGPITLGCYSTLAPTVLPRILEEFGARHPGVATTIVEASQDSLQAGLADGSLDLAIVYDMQITGNPNRMPLYAIPPHVLLSADHPLAGSGRVRLADLANDPFILLDAPPSSAHTHSLFAQHDLHPVARYRTGSYETVRALVGRGLGYGVLVQRPLTDLSYEGRRVVMVELDPPVTPIGVFLIWPEGTALTPRADALVEFARGLEWTPASG